MIAHEDRAAFRAFVTERNLGVTRLGALLVALMMPFGSLLDWFTHPEYTERFLALRLGAALLSLLVLGLTFTRWARRFIVPLAMAPLLAAAAAIGWMIVELEGYASPYYAGLNLVILGMGIGFTWRMLETVIATQLVVAIWLVPALLELPDVEAGPFFNNLYFLFLTSVIAVACNHTRYRQIEREYIARSEVARTSAQLASALSRLRELDRLKSEFFANISHELRTPLTLILSPVEERLSRGETDPLFGVIRRNAQRLLRLIDDLLDLSRIDAGRLRLVLGPVDLRTLVEHAVNAFHPAAAAKQITLETDLPASTEGLYGDPHRLEMILSNLLGNALKYTPAGGTIRIVVRRQSDAVELSVIDTGPGIPAEELPRIFDRFHQVESSARRRQEGAGIGLALARELAELHGGTLQAESVVGTGSTFRLRLPLGRDHFRPEVIERRRVAMEVPVGRRASDHAAPNMEPPPTPEPALPREDPEPVVLEGGRRARILVAEDHADLREFLRNLLAPLYDVETAENGREALEMMRQLRPDLVLTDLMMPELTGTDLCEAIRSDESLRTTPIILLTARSGTEAVLEGYHAGADDFVTKPVHPRILLARIRAQLRLRAMGLQLAQQGRLAAVGTLAAGVGHEVRNPINAVINGARALLARDDLDPGMRRILEVVEDAGKRVETISAALLEHAHPGEMDRPRPCDPRAGIEATLRLLEHRTKNVRVHRSYGTDIAVIASPPALNQVFLNLLDNALRSSAQNVWIHVEGHGDRVQVRVEDDGPGVPAEIANRIFDPFFTTREPGDGTGLGLYLSRKIVTSHGGDLRLGNRPGGGASFTIDLPAEAKR